MATTRAPLAYLSPCSRLISLQTASTASTRACDWTESHAITGAHIDIRHTSKHDSRRRDCPDTAAMSDAEPEIVKGDVLRW